jgi:acyl-CoA reductase-like NAD-dependent aldehyde dehydrogenase
MSATETAAPFAAEAARCRAAQRAWAGLSVRQRLRPVRALRHLLAQEAESLCAAVENDLGRPPTEVLGSDVIPTADACRFLERQAARLLRPAPVSWRQRPVWLWGQSDVVHRRPHGVVGVIGTWNYPILLNGIQLAQALAAGNGVLWKPSEVAPATATALHEVFLRAGFPPDLVQRLPATREAGPQLAEAEVDFVVFTGSAGVGRALAARLGQRLVPSTLELSGCDAMFVLADADLGLAASAAWFGATLNRGQTCLAVRRVFVDRSRYGDFLAALRPLATAARPQPLMLPSQVSQAERLVDEATAAGARLLDRDPAAHGEGCPPTVVIDARPEMAICREASFAPLLAVLPFDTPEDALAMNARCPFGLGASVFTGRPATASWWAERLAVGTLAVNDVIAPTAHPATPFGGRGAAGWGVTQGADGLLALTVPQVVSVRRGRLRLHYDLATEPAAPDLLGGLLQWSHGRGVRQRWRGLWRMVRGAFAVALRRNRKPEGPLPH